MPKTLLLLAFASSSRCGSRRSRVIATYPQPYTRAFSRFSAGTV